MTDIAAIVETLTTEEKIRLVHGSYPDWGSTKPGADGYLPPIDRLGIRALRFEDGPLGVTSGGTAFPASLALGATFDVGLAETFGEAIGAEARAHGVDVLLAPGCNLIRVPRCGRNFEYYSEDPCHAARLAGATVRGIQSQGVVATPKHYVANNQEVERVRASARVDARALRELYLPAFEAAVREGDAGAVMAAYNRVNGEYATEHRTLLTDVLRNEIGFDGPVLSDWWAVRDGLRAARAGLDLEMPGVGAIDWLAMQREALRPLRFVATTWPEPVPGIEEAAARLFEITGGPGGEPRPRRSLFARTLPAGMDRGTFDESRLDEMVGRVLTLYERVGALDGSCRTAGGDCTEHRGLAKRIATKGAVLLKNADDTLPLDPGTSVGVIGPHVDEAKTGGGGSSEVWATAAVSPLEGIRARATGRVIAERGHPAIGTESLLGISLSSPTDPEPRALREDARAAAAETDAAVVVVQDDAAEGRDRSSLSLPGHQDELVSAVAEIAEQTVVVAQTAGPIDMPWIDEVEAVLETWYPGQEAGGALASLIYGDVDPGGCLPVTFGSESQYPTNLPSRYPGIPGSDGSPVTRYGEGIFVGYRHFDERDVDPLFPFGHGLSYAAFVFEDLEAVREGEDLLVSVTVENTGDRRGRDVVQLYLRHRNPSVPRPVRELVGFEAVTLDPTERRTIEMEVDDRAFAYYDEGDGDWVTESGEFAIEVARSSRDIRTAVTVEK